MRKARRVAVAGMIVLLAAGTGVASAQQAPDPAVLEEKAYQDFAAGRFEEALHGLERVYRLAPRPEVLFAIGNLQQRLGRCNRAIETLEDYLATGATAGAAKARELIEGCRAAVPAVEPAPEPEPKKVAPPEVEPAPDPELAPAPVVRRDGDPGRGRRRAALVLGGVTVIAAGAAVASELIGRSHLRESDRLGGEGRKAESDAEFETANNYHYLAQGIAVAGLGCAVTATILWVTGRDTGAPVAATAVRGGAVVAWRGAF